jgi:hypothetical protein
VLWWFLLWAVLVIGAVAVFFLLGRRLYRQGKALVHEMTEASDRLGAISAALAAQEATPPAGPPGRR